MMKMNEDRNNYQNADVYAGLNASYSSTYLSDTQEFSLQSVQEKLGSFSQVEDTANNGALNADVMPTQQTLTMNYQREYQQNSIATSSKLNTKAKVAIISYVAVVLALVLGITFASIAVSGAFNQTVALTGDYNAALEQIASLEAQLSVEDTHALELRAAELGYINPDASNVQYFTRVETRPAQNFQIDTNWFDSLCDWLSGVFGG